MKIAFSNKFDKIPLSRGSYRVSLNNSKSSLSNGPTKNFSILPNNTVPTNIDKSIEKTFLVSSKFTQNSFNMKEHSVSDRIKKFHIQSRSLNQAILNNNLGFNILKTKLN